MPYSSSKCALHVHPKTIVLMCRQKTSAKKVNLSMIEQSV